MKVYLGIDIGTSGVKALALTPGGTIVARGMAEQTFQIPHPGWAEQDPDVWVDSVCRAVQQITAQLGSDMTIACVGFSGQMLGCIPLDESKRVLAPCMMWLDSRSEEENRALIEMYGLDFWWDQTGNMPLSSYWVSKLMWLKNHRPEILDKTRYLLFPKDYVRLFLTGEVATEVADASATCLFDTVKRCWNSEIFTMLGLDQKMIPEKLLESGDIAGTITEEAARKTGIPVGTPVIAGAGDQAMGGIGNGVVEDGMISVTIGTSGVVFTSTDKPLVDKQERAGLCYCHAVRDKWCFFGCTNAAGGSFQWLRNTLGRMEMEQAKVQDVDPYVLMTACAQQAEIGSRGLYFLPYLNGERTPHTDDNARGVFFGLSLAHGWNEIVRSVMEGITFSLRDSLEILREHGVRPKKIFASGGGAKSDAWLQMQADIFNTTIVRNNIDEGPACGAAIAAMVACGEYENESEACAHILKPALQVEPIAENVARYDEIYNFYRSLYPDMKDAFARHGKLHNR